VKQFWDFIVVFFSILWKVISSLSTSFVQYMWNPIQTKVLYPIFKVMVDCVKFLLEGISSLIQHLWACLANGFNSLWGTISLFIMEYIWNPIMKVWHPIWRLILYCFGNFLEGITWLVQQLWNIISNMLYFIWLLLCLIFSVTEQLIFPEVMGISSQNFTLAIAPGTAEELNSQIYYRLSNGSEFAVKLSNKNSNIRSNCKLLINGIEIGTYRLDQSSTYSIKTCKNGKPFLYNEQKKEFPIEAIFLS